MKTYYINQFPHPPIRVDIEQDPPPCLMCDAPVAEPSMGGPLICPSCDMGRNPDGSRITPSQHEARRARVQTKIAAYREAAAARDREAGGPAAPIENDPTVVVALIPPG